MARATRAIQGQIANMRQLPCAVMLITLYWEVAPVQTGHAKDTAFTINKACCLCPSVLTVLSTDDIRLHIRSATASVHLFVMMTNLHATAYHIRSAAHAQILGAPYAALLLAYNLDLMLDACRVLGGAAL